MNVSEIPPGHVAEVVTLLEMRERPKPAPMPACPLRLKRWHPVDLDNYRILFERVGAPWLWFSRLELSDAELDAIVADAQVDFHAVEDRRGVEVGMIELDFRHEAACEIQFFGLVPELGGKGYGRWLMMQTLALTWREKIERVHLHTCTLDHPRALGFYRHMGFEPRRRWIETFADPRLTGTLPRDCAPHVPILEA